jgi:hypothetical protein
VGEARKKDPSFRLGVALMLASFALYPAYGAIALLPLSAEGKVICGLAGWMASWTIFTVGSMLAGRRGVEYVRRVLWRERAITPPES